MNVAWDFCWGGSGSAKHCFSVRSDVYSLPQCNRGFKLLWVRLCVRGSGGLESVVADRCGLATWLLSCVVATCKDMSGFATCRCKTHCQRKLGSNLPNFYCGDLGKWGLREVVTEGSGGWGKWFLHGVLQLVVVHVCVVVGCHVRAYMRFCHVMFPNAL